MVVADYIFVDGFYRRGQDDKAVDGCCRIN